MQAVPEDTHRAETIDRGSSAAAVSGVMLKDIVPNDPRERRKRNRLYALRALDRLGLLGEENLIPTLASRPELRWLVDEQGARWEVLSELGRIREPERFQAAVGWVIRTRLKTKEATIKIRRFRADTIELPGAPGSESA
jgi:hypothetical protein